MTKFQRDIFDFVKEVNPQSLYSSGFEDLGEKIFMPSAENLEIARKKVHDLRSRLRKKDALEKKYLDSVENMLEFEEPIPDIGMVSEILSNHLLKEGVNPIRFKVLMEQLCDSIRASIAKYSGKSFPVAIKILVQYQVLGAKEILDTIERESMDAELIEKISKLRNLVDEYKKRFEVEGFTDGSFEQVVDLLRKNGSDMGRQDFYPKALKFGFDYSETPSQLERKALGWIKEDLPKMRYAAKSLSKMLGCESNLEAIGKKLRSVPGVRPEEALEATLKIRPVVQALVGEAIVGMNPKYETKVIETPSYLSAIIPSGAATGFDSFTSHPTQRFFLTTDPKRDPPGGFADIVNLLVHEEYGHCLHFSNTAMQFAAKPGIIELLPSLHSGATSEGLAFQRELEFLDAIRALAKKNPKNYTESEKRYVSLSEEFGGFKQTCLQLEFTTYKQRIVRFLRVVGDSRINSGKQNLIDFLAWAEKTTGLSQRTVYFQLFPAHEGSYPGYATCYAVIGQEIRSIQRPFKNDRKKMVKFNAFACSMGYPSRSIYSKRLREFAKRLSKKRKHFRARKAKRRK